MLQMQWTSGVRGCLGTGRLGAWPTSTVRVRGTILEISVFRLRIRSQLDIDFRSPCNYGLLHSLRQLKSDRKNSLERSQMPCEKSFAMLTCLTISSNCEGERERSPNCEGENKKKRIIFFLQNAMQMQLSGCVKAGRLGAVDL